MTVVLFLLALWCASNVAVVLFAGYCAHARERELGRARARRFGTVRGRPGGWPVRL